MNGKIKTVIEYISYIARVLEQYYKEKKEVPYICLIIIYTGDVEKASRVVEADCFSLRLEQVFLVNLKSEDICQRIKAKIERQEKLTDEELMQLTILQLTEKGSDKKKNY